MPASQRLTALDASFLASESVRTPMHVGSLSIFEAEPFLDENGAFRIDDLRALIVERLPLAPRLQQRVQEVPWRLARPVWVDDPAFDIANHVKSIRLDPPGTDAELRSLAARLHMQLLDRSRPLWELWCVEGLADGHVAMIQKIHHAMVDGVASVDLSTTLMDLSAEVAHYEVPPIAASRTPGPVALAATALADNTAAAAHLAAATIGHAVRLGSTLRGIRAAADPVSSLLSRRLVAPRSPLNWPVGETRRFEVVRQSLAETKEIGAALGGTVNDVVLTAVAGGLHQLYEARGVEAPEALQALVPVSVRSNDGPALGNQVGAILAPLPVAESDPEARFRAVKAGMRERKDKNQASATTALMHVSDYLPVRFSDWLSRSIHRQPFVNLVVTNVPGPQVPLYSMGSRLIETFPIVPLGGNLDISVGILSYDGQLNFGLFADVDTAADVGVLAEGIEKAFVELRHLADTSSRQGATS